MQRERSRDEGGTTYKVEEARFVSSCFSWPSSARPHLSLLLANNGVSSNVFDNVNPGPSGNPSLYKTHTPPATGRNGVTRGKTNPQERRRKKKREEPGRSCTAIRVTELYSNIRYRDSRVKIPVNPLHHS
jgi:hypothetical protein